MAADKTRRDMRTNPGDSEEKYKALYYYSHDAIMTVDPKEGFLSGNPATIKMFGCKDEKEFISKSPAELSPEYQPDGKLSTVKAQEMMAAALDKGSHFFEWVHMKIDGTTFPATVLLSRVEINGKKLLQATVRDITIEEEIKSRLKRAVDEWDRTFNAVADGILIIDKDHNIRKVNSFLCDFLKVKPEEIIGKKCYEVLHKMKEPWPDCPMEKTNRDKKPHAEEVNDPAIGIPLLVTTSPVFDEEGGYIGVVHVAKNISDFKKIEEDLKRKVATLERFQKVTVDRELKMKELKSRIAELEAKLAAKEKHANQAKRT